MPNAALPQDDTAEVEHFCWVGRQWNITKLRGDLKDGRLRPTTSEFPREFIEGYAEQVLGLSGTPEESDKKIVFRLVSISARRAVELPSEALEEPVVLLHAGKGRGIVNLGSGADYLLADGNHRMGKAYFETVEKLPVVVLSQAQSRRYLET